jgi:hypothetical protein
MEFAIASLHEAHVPEDASSWKFNIQVRARDMQDMI